MNVVTGGAGYIGAHLVEQLLERGEEVRVIDKPGARVEHLPLARIELAPADIRDVSGLRRALAGCKRVYHLAADPNLWRRRREEFNAINRIGTENVLQVALDAGAERVLHVSTESILTAPGFAGGAVETLKLDAADMLGPYCLSKYHAECAAFRYAAAGAPVVVAAPTLPVGPGDRGQTPPTRLAVAFCRGELPAYLDCRFNLIDVRDVAAGMILALDKGRPGVRYLLGNANVHLTQWLEMLGQACNRAAPRWKVPYTFALAMAWLSEHWADRVSGKIPMATLTGVRLTQRCMHFDPGATLAELGLQPRKIEQSAHDAVAWYRMQGWILKSKTDQVGAYVRPNSSANRRIRCP